MKKDCFPLKKLFLLKNFSIERSNIKSYQDHRQKKYLISFMHTIYDGNHKKHKMMKRIAKVPQNWHFL
jgi:type IV secretory pathway component VirB8